MVPLLCSTHVIGLKALKLLVRHVRATSPGRSCVERLDDFAVVNSITTVPFGNVTLWTVDTILICPPPLTTQASLVVNQLVFEPANHAGSWLHFVHGD